MENIDVDTRAECLDTSGEWDEELDVCWEYQDDQFGATAPIDGVEITYAVTEYPGGYIPMARITTPDGRILYDTEGWESDRAEAAEDSAREMAASIAHDIERTVPGSATYGDLAKYEIGEHEVVARSREQALEIIEDATGGDLPRGQRRL